MKLHFRLVTVATLFVVLAASTTPVRGDDLAPDDDYAPDPAVTLQLVSGLGVKKEINVSRTWIEGSELLTQMSTVHANGGSVWGLDSVYHRDEQSYVYLRSAVFQRTDGIVLIIPWTLIKQATSTGKIQTLTLKDESEHRGTFLSRVRDKTRKQYDLGTATSMSVVAVTPGPGPAKKPGKTEEKQSSNGEEQPVKWRLSLKGQEHPVEINNPRFAILFSFWADGGNLFVKKRVQKTWSQKNQNFAIVVNERETLGTLSDFERVQLANDQITVTAPGADPITGTIALYGTEFEGRRHKADEWLFWCEVAAGYTMLIPTPEIQLEKQEAETAR